MRKLASMMLATLLGAMSFVANPTALASLAASALDTCLGFEIAAQKSEGNVLKIENTAVKVEVNASSSEKGRDDSAGQPGRTEYEGRPLVCERGADGYVHCGERK